MNMQIILTNLKNSNDIEALVASAVDATLFKYSFSIYVKYYSENDKNMQ